MSNVAPFRPKHSDLTNSDADALSRTVFDAIKTLVSGLGPGERARLLDEITVIIRPIPTPRAGALMSIIVRLLPNRKSWTIDELKRGVAEQGVEAAPKEVYNAVSYLARKKHIRRVGYGRYIVEGVEVVTSEDLGVGLSRTEEMDPN
jgi:hypothetical protein